MQGVGFRPVRLPPGARSTAWPASCATTSTGSRSRSRARARRSSGSSRALARRAPPLARVAARARRGRCRPPAATGFVDRRQRRGGRRPTRSSPPTPRRARTASPSCSTRPTAATATRSSTARTAGRASRSCAASPTTARRRRWRRFAMCAACRAEYDDPRDRRFHAQPNACPACGPAAALRGRRARGRGRTPSPRRARLLRDGAIVAVKGLGGYHLACRADDERAVARLRARKHREDKPFALMVAGVAEARALVALDGAAEALLTAPARPIVLAPRARRPRASRPPSRPALRELGVMLPYTPLHHLLLHDAGCAAGADQRQRLRRADRLHRRRRPLAPGGHRRRVAACTTARSTSRTDDSVAALDRPRPRAQVLRRSRGIVPEALALPVAVHRAGARLRRRAEEHVLPGPRHARVGRPPHRRPAHRRDAALLPRGRRALRARSSTCARASSPTTCTPTTCRPPTRSSATASRHVGRAAPPRAPRGRAGRARRDGAGGRGDLRRRRATAPTARSGAASCCSATWPASRASGTCTRSRCPAATARRASRGAWPARGSSRRATTSPRSRRRCAARSAGDRWRAVAHMARTGFAAPPTTSAGRLFDAVAALCGVRVGQPLRGPGGDRARGRRGPGRARELRRCDGARPARGDRRDRRRRRGGRAGGRRVGALPPRAGRGDRHGVRGGRRARGDRPGRARRAASSTTACC